MQQTFRVFPQQFERGSFDENIPGQPPLRGKPGHLVMGRLACGKIPDPRKPLHCQVIHISFLVRKNAGEPTPVPFKKRDVQRRGQPAPRQRTKLHPAQNHGAVEARVNFFRGENQMVCGGPRLQRPRERPRKDQRMQEPEQQERHDRRKNPHFAEHARHAR